MWGSGRGWTLKWEKHVILYPPKRAEVTTISDTPDDKALMVLRRDGE